MSVINTNVRALTAQSSLRKINGELSTAMERLSTGLRVNGADDDAAGLAIANRMTADIRGTAMAIRNANDGLSLLQTAEGTLGEIGNVLQRMRELAVQAANGTALDSDRSASNTEVSQLMSQIDALATQIQFNRNDLLSAGSTTFTLQLGAAKAQTMDVVLNGATTTALAVTGVAITSVGLANTAIATIDSAITTVSTRLATIGAYQNRLNYTINNLESFKNNTSASRSRIMDTDYADETTKLAKSQIIQQAATAMLAQANQSPQTVLALLK